jgi:hypothetical protein
MTSEFCKDGHILWKTELNDEMINEWISLHKRSSNYLKCADGKTDCGAQCLAMLNIIDEEKALLLARVSKDIGLTNLETNITIGDSINEPSKKKQKTADIISTSHIDLRDDNLYTYLNSKLLPNEGTLLLLINKNDGEIGHFVIIRKSVSNKLEILCPQTQTALYDDLSKALMVKYKAVIFTCVSNSDSLKDSGKRKRRTRRNKKYNKKSKKHHKKRSYKKHHKKHHKKTHKKH